MSRFDQAKMLMRVKKIQKELQKQVITVEKGEGAVRVEITGEQKIKKVHIDPEFVDLDDIGQTGWRCCLPISIIAPAHHRPVRLQRQRMIFSRCNRHHIDQIGLKRCLAMTIITPAHHHPVRFQRQ